MELVAVKDIPKEIVAHFWSSGSEIISERSRQRGLQYAFEKYIHNITCHRSNDNENEFKIEAKAYRSQCKSQPPHLLSVRVLDKHITEQQCSCVAG